MSDIDIFIKLAVALRVLFKVTICICAKTGQTDAYKYMQVKFKSVFLNKYSNELKTWVDLLKVSYSTLHSYFIY